MPDIAQNVIVNFEIGTNELTPALEQLAKGGKIDATGFKGIQDAINATATDTKGLIKQFKDVGTASVKMGKSVEDAFGAGITDALDEAGVSLKEFETALKKTTQPSVSLKKEMLQLKEALARMKAEGKDTGKEFEALRARAGKLADAISDANAEIKNAGSDTRGIDNVVGSISALAGGYAAVQGAAALFGEENEDLQKALLKVNGAMALATGTQQLLNAVQKEGSLAKLADVVATGAQTTAQKVYAIAVGESTGAMKIFRTVLLGLGIGAIIGLLVLAADAMGLFGSKTDTAADRARELADEFERLNTQLEDANTKLSRSGDIAIEKLRQRGATEKEIHDQNIKNIQAENALLQLGNKERIKTLKEEDRISSKADADALAAIKRRTLESDKITDGNRKRLEQEVKGLEEIGNAFKKIDDNNAAIALKNEQFKTKIAEDGFKKRKEFLDKQAKALEDALKEAERQELEAAKNAIQANLDKVNKVIEQERIAFDNIADLKAEADARMLAGNEAYAAKWKEFQESLTKSAQTEIDKRKKAEEDERAQRIKNINAIVEAAQQVANVFAALGALQTERTNQQIEANRKRVKEDLEAGIITSKAAALLMKQLDEKERKARQKQAQREKDAAVFTALLAIPKAILQGLSTGGPAAIALAAIFGALAAAQAAIIIARPVPKFFRGKKGNYEGPGIVGDMGSELVEREGRMYLYTKPTQTYLGAKDKVYTAAETRTIMHNTNISTIPATANGQHVDMERLIKSIPVSNTQVSIDKDFIRESVRDGLMITNYWSKRYSSKR